MKFKFNNLDSIRSFAFLSTFLAHCFNTDVAEVKSSELYRLAINFRSVFSFGVPIFFVLSGFLITYLIFKEYEKTSAFSVKNFYIRRVLRIWPVYYAVLLFGFVIFPFFRTNILHLPYTETASVVKYIFFLSNFDQIAKGVLPFGVGLGPTWSVGVEEQFYLFWPLLFFVLPGKKFILPITILLVAVAVTSYAWKLPAQHTLFCLIYLSTGAAYAYLSFYHNNLVKRWVDIKPVFFIALIALLFLLMGYKSVLQFRIPVIVLISLMIGYIIIFQCYAGKLEFRKIPFIEALGKYTYGLYLYHSICIFVVHTFFVRVLKVEDSIWGVMLVKPLFALILSVIVSYISYEYMEAYFLRLKEKFSS